MSHVHEMFFQSHGHSICIRHQRPAYSVKPQNVTTTCIQGSYVSKIIAMILTKTTTNQPNIDGAKKLKIIYIDSLCLPRRVALLV